MARQFKVHPRIWLTMPKSSTRVRPLVARTRRGVRTRTVKSPAAVDRRAAPDLQLNLLSGDEPFRLLFEQTPLAMVLFDEQTLSVVAVNAAALNLYGYDRAAFLACNLRDLWPDELFEEMLRAPAESLVTDATTGRLRISRHRRCDGAGFAARVATQQLRLADRCLRLATVIDASRRVEMEQILRRQALVFDNLIDAVLIVDPQRAILDWNPGAERMFGWKKNEVLGKSTALLRRPEEYPRLRKAIADALAADGRYEGEMDFVRKDGSIGVGETVVVPLRDEHANEIARVCVVRDISERKLAATRLFESEIRHRAVVQASLDAIISIDRHGRITEFNPAAEATFGYTRAEAIVSTLEQTIIPPALRDAHKQGMRKFFATGHGPVLGKRIEITAVRKNRTEFPVELAIQRLEIKGEVAFTASLRDISARKAQEQALHRANRLYAALSHTNQAIVQARDEGELYRAICDIAIEHAQFSLAWIGLANPATREAQVVAAGGPQLEYLQSTRVSVDPDLPLGQGAFGTAFRGGKPVIVNDFHADPASRPWRAAGERAGFNAAAAFPFSANGRTAGVLMLYSTEKNYFEPSLTALLTEMASDISFALDNLQRKSALRESEERLRITFEQAAVGIAHMALDGRFFAANRKLTQMLGLTRQELAALTDRDVTHPEDVSATYGYVAQVRKNHERPNFIVKRYLRKDGAPVWAHLAVSLVRDGAGAAQYFISVIEDVTERRRAEDALRESEELSRTIVESSRDCIKTLDLDGRLLSLSAKGMAALEICDVTPFIGTSWVEFWNGADRDAASEAVALARSGGEGRFLGYFATTQTRTPRWWDVSISPMLDAGARPVKLLAVSRDVTERVLAEQATQLRASRQQTLARFGQFALGCPDLASLLERAAEVVVAGDWIQKSIVCELLPDGRSLALRAGVGWPSNVAGHTVIDATASESLLGYLLQQRQPVVVEDFRSETRFAAPAFAIEHELRSAIGVPITTQAGVFGTLGGAGTHVRKFSNDDVDFLQTIAALLGTAIDRIEAESRVAYLAQFDTLTGLPNRNLFRDRLNQALARCARTGSRLAVLFLDLDRFKEINDTLGHDAGDDVLKLTAVRLTDALRSGDTVARLGGDEFTILIEDMTDDDDQVDLLARKLIECIGRPITVAGAELFVNASIGVALSAFGAASDALLKQADIAMYRAKHSGGATFLRYSAEMDASLSERVGIETALRRAVERGELLLHYQPRIDGRSGRIVGVEALLRWLHPELGLVPPARFIGVAEQTGLIEPIGEWVLHAACEQNVRWRAAGLAPLKMAVNVSARQFRRANLKDIVERVLAASDMEATALELEITEGVLVEQPEAKKAMLAELQERGIKIAIDDFGTGYSSFSYLRHLAVDVLKIDRSFVAGLGSEPESAAICAAIISLARNLDLTVVAEGVETRVQWESLRRQHCDAYQGFLFSRPLPAEELAELLARSPRFDFLPPSRACPGLDPGWSWSR